jgi:hypothetical protein
MKLLNLILIVLIIIILKEMEPFTYITKYFSFTFIGDFYLGVVDNNSLVFIKPENLSKTELVEKFKELSSSKSLNSLKDNKIKKKISITDLFKDCYSKISTFIQKFYGALTKIALFSIIIRYLSKMKLLRFIFTILNSMLLSMFGIVFSDVYGFQEILEYIRGYWNGYVDFIHDTKFYKVLVKIFKVVKESNIENTDVKESNIKIDNINFDNKNNSNSEIIENKESYDFPSSDQQIKREKIRDATNNWENFENSKIREDSDTPFYRNKYFLIGISIITLGLIYIYWDSINELFKNVKPSDTSSDGTNTPIYTTHQEEYQKYFKELETNQELYDLDVIRSQDKGKVIDYSDVEHTKWEDSPTTPKPSTSKLPETDVIMLPISRK